MRFVGTTGVLDVGGEGCAEKKEMIKPGKDLKERSVLSVATQYKYTYTSTRRDQQDGAIACLRLEAPPFLNIHYPFELARAEKRSCGNANTMFPPPLF